MAHAHSPSPPPPTPIPATPGPRASQFSSLFYNALQHTLKTCSYANFSSCFPSAAAKDPVVLQSVHTQITEMINERAGREFEEILQEREVVPGLNHLENLLAEARSRKAEGGSPPPQPLHTLPPHVLYLTQLSLYLTDTQSSLKNELTALEFENEELAETLQTQRDQIEQILVKLQAAVEDLEGTNNILGNAIHTVDLRAEICEVQAEKVPESKS